MAEAWLDRFSRSEFDGIDNANASFKGIPFILEASNTTFGRRLIPHEYPQKDIPFTEDLGRRVRIFNVAGKILGADYLTVRDRLIALSEDQGVGELINPFFGSAQVILEQIKFTDELREGRITSFEAVFFEVGELQFPIEETDTQNEVTNQVNNSIQSFKTPFEKIYDVLSQPLVFSQGKLESLNQAYDAIDKAKAIANIGPTFQRDLNAFRIQSEGIITSGEKVFNSLVDLITFGLFDNDDINQNESFDQLLTLLDFSATGQPESGGSNEIGNLIQKIAIASLSQNISNIEFTSANEAKELRDKILTKLDEILLAGQDPEIVESLTNLKSAVVEDTNTRSINLPVIRSITPNKTIPALVLSQQIYGNADNADDIVDRNKIKHPGFIAGGEQLEILVDVQ